MCVLEAFCWLCQDPPLPGTPLEGTSKKKERQQKAATGISSTSESNGEHESDSSNGFNQVATDPAGLYLPKLQLCCTLLQIPGVVLSITVQTDLHITAVCFGERRVLLRKAMSPSSLFDEGLDKVEDAYEEDKQRGHNETVSITGKGAAQHAQSPADGSSSSSNGSSNSSSSNDGNGVSTRMDFWTGLCSGLPILHVFLRECLPQY